MNLKRRKFYVFVVFLIFFSLIIFALCRPYKIPPDSELVSFFIKHESDLMILVNMISTEPSDIIGITQHQVMFKEVSHWVMPQEANMSLSRFNSYQKLMSKNNIEQIWKYNGGIYFLGEFWGWGFASYGPRLTYAYCLNVPPNLVETLDNITKNDSGMTIVYRPLRNHWYIRLIW